MKQPAHYILSNAGRISIRQVRVGLFDIYSDIWMRTALKPWQKILAYSSLVFVLAWTLFGLYAIWLILTQE